MNDYIHKSMSERVNHTITQQPGTLGRLVIEFTGHAITQATRHRQTAGAQACGLGPYLRHLKELVAVDPPSFAGQDSLDSMPSCFVWDSYDVYL
jgi:hypothetical protein